jgi:hypothetical protein
VTKETSVRQFGLMIAAIGLTAAPALAGPGKAGISDACRAEIVQLCPKTGDKQARRACMKEKRGQVSEGCRAEIMAAREKLRAAKKAESMSAAPVKTEN